MKKAYSTPEIEKINFQYRDQVVAASGSHVCITEWTNNSTDSTCKGTTTSSSEHV